MKVGNVDWRIQRVLATRQMGAGSDKRDNKVSERQAKESRMGRVQEEFAKFSDTLLLPTASLDDLLYDAISEKQKRQNALIGEDPAPAQGRILALIPLLSHHRP